MRVDLGLTLLILFVFGVLFVGFACFADSLFVVYCLWVYGLDLIVWIVGLYLFMIVDLLTCVVYFNCVLDFGDYCILWLLFTWVLITFGWFYWIYVCWF